MLARRLLLSLVSVLVVWGAFELWMGRGGGGAVVRSFEPSGEQVERWTQRLDRLRTFASGEAQRKKPRLVVFSARYGWEPVPGTSGELAGDRVSFDARGARGTRAAAPEGARRVVCYGDSFTFGSEVDDGEDYPAQLEAAAGGALEVLNLGMMGWGTDQALLRARDTLGELAPDVALMGLMSENVQRNVNRLVQVRAPGERLPLVKPRFLLEDGALTLLPVPYRSELELYEAAIDGRIGVDLAPHEWLAASDLAGSWSAVADRVRLERERTARRRWWEQWHRPDGEPFRVTLALLEAFHREARAAGAGFAGVVIFPSRTDLDEPTRKLTLLHAELEEARVPYLDLYDLIAARQGRGEPTYGAMHLTPGANGEVAEAVREWLEGAR